MFSFRGPVNQSFMDSNIWTFLGEFVLDIWFSVSTEQDQKVNRVKSATAWVLLNDILAFAFTYFDHFCCGIPENSFISIKFPFQQLQYWWPRTSFQAHSLSYALTKRQFWGVQLPQVKPFPSIFTSILWIYAHEELQLSKYLWIAGVNHCCSSW